MKEAPPPGMKGKKAFLKIIVVALGVFLALLIGVFFVRSRGGPPASGFLASLFSSFSGFLSREAPIAEIDISKSDSRAGKPCAYEDGASPSRAAVVISEIAWMGSEEDYNSEWIELQNISAFDADISRWRLKSADGKIDVLFPENAVLPKGGHYVLSRKGKGNVAYEGALLNGGMALRLFASSCALEDEVSPGKWPAGDNKTKQTMERAPDLSWRDSALPGGTPGAPNSRGEEAHSSENKEVRLPAEVRLPGSNQKTMEGSGTSSHSEIVPVYSSFVINEIFVGDEYSSNNEYIELWNPSSESAPLTGWSVKKRSGTGALSTLLSALRLEGKMIPANGFFLIANEGGSFASEAGAVWAKSNTLAYSNNSVLLMNPKGEMIQEASWAEIPKGKSFSRREDGNFGISESSPKQPN